MIRAAFALVCFTVPAQAAEFEFCWFGNDGYALFGHMTVEDQALTLPLVTESDVTAFVISGTRNGSPLGSWSMQDLTPETSWNLNFDPVAMVFATSGFSSTTSGQEWNASGAVNNCGASGFGFNSGSGGQDVCIKNTWRSDSTIPAATPFPVYLLGEGPTCSAAPLLGGLMPRDRSAS